MKGKKQRQVGKTVRNGLHPGPLSSLTLSQENILYMVQDYSHLTVAWKKQYYISGLFPLAHHSAPWHHLVPWYKCM